MKVYILANGESTRWNKYRGVDKQMIVIDGEPILRRTVRLLNEEGLKAKQIVICGKQRIKGSTKILTTSPTKREVFEELVDLSDEPFLILYGDCYYTKDLIHDALTREIKEYAEWFCASGNPNTGKKWAEGYAHRVENLDKFKMEIHELNEAVTNGWIDYYSDWVLHWWMLGERENLNRHPVQVFDKEKDIYWCDETDDFDYPTDLEHFLRTTKHKGPEKSYVSVIIPYYNSRKWFEPLLNKLVFQKKKYYPETEIVVVNDCSTEDVSWLDHFSDSVKIIHNAENKGVSYSRNVGLDNSGGDYIQFVDSDDDITDDFLHVIYTNIRKGYDYLLYRWYVGDSITMGDVHKESLLWNWAVWGYTLTRATVWGHKFDETLRVTEDLEFLRKVITPTLNRHFIEKPIYRYNTHNPESLSHLYNSGKITMKM